MNEAQNQRKEADSRADSYRRHKFAQMAKDRVQCGCGACGSFGESCTSCNLQRENFFEGQGKHTGQPRSCRPPRRYRRWMRLGYSIGDCCHLRVHGWGPCGTMHSVYGHTCRRPAVLVSGVKKSLSH